MLLEGTRWIVEVAVGVCTHSKEGKLISGPHWRRSLIGR